LLYNAVRMMCIVYRTIWCVSWYTNTPVYRFGTTRRNVCVWNNLVYKCYLCKRYVEVSIS